MITTPTPAPEPMQPLYAFDGMDARLAEVELMIDDELYVLSADVLTIFQEVIYRYETERELKAETLAFVEADRATQASTIAELEARVAELERELSDVSVWGQACDDVCAELRQQLDDAQAGWETVENGSYWVYVNKEGSRVYKKRDEYPNTEGYFTVSGKLDFDWLSVSLPDNWRLQRRKAGGDE